MPPKAKTEISVYITTNRSEEWIWKTGKTNVAIPRAKQLYGRADLLCAVPVEQGLIINIDNVPAKGHANISGFPTRRSEQKEIALRLASEAELIINY